MGQGDTGGYSDCSKHLCNYSEADYGHDVCGQIAIKGTKTKFALSLSLKTVLILVSHMQEIINDCVFQQTSYEMIYRVNSQIATLFHHVTLPIDNEVSVSYGVLFCYYSVPLTWYTHGFEIIKKHI